MDMYIVHTTQPLTTHNTNINNIIKIINNNKEMSPIIEDLTINTSEYGRQIQAKKDGYILAYIFIDIYTNDLGMNMDTDIPLEIVGFIFFSRVAVTVPRNAAKNQNYQIWILHTYVPTVTINKYTPPIINNYITWQCHKTLIINKYTTLIINLYFYD